MTNPLFNNLKNPLLAGLILIAAFAPAMATADTSLKDFDGNVKNVDQYTGNGKWLVVMLWASDCAVCNREVHEYVAFHKQHHNKDARMLGVSLDGEAKKADARGFLKKHNVNFPSLIGDPLTVAAMYQNLTGDTWVGTPSFMVYTPDGKLLGAQAGAVPVSVIESFIQRESSGAATP
ncbi:MAG: TlpA disulfide reductase family protein [Gammaproteobacteria bacterium]|jgi:peroxiredoxin